MELNKPCNGIVCELTSWRASSAELVILMHTWNLNQHVIITLVVMKASLGLGCISKGTSNQSREVFIPIFLELMCFLLEYCVWFGALQ